MGENRSSMEILQQYYTSFVNKETGHAGFQVQAMSPGISAEIQGIIARMVAYRIPAGMNERAIETHPVALRYYYHEPHRLGILVCSQSNGRDDGGRPGNFFAHTVVLPAEILTSLPPVLYWHSPFWRKKAEATTAIPALPEFPAPPSWTLIDDIWAFLANEARQEAFYHLMCAVVYSTKSKRRIIIIDTDEHVALWVAAICTMLPPLYRPLLSFTTYHHDPYQSWLLITGTPDDSWMRSSAEGHLTHFILDGRTNTTSQVDTSIYADLIKSTHYRSNRYEDILLPLFVDFEKRFPQPTRLDEQLDGLALYTHLRNHPEITSLKARHLEIIAIVLSSFEALTTFENDDWEELKYWRKLLEKARQESSLPSVEDAYDRAARIFDNHDVKVPEHLAADVKHYTKQLMKVQIPESVDKAAAALDRQRQKYSEQAFVEYVNSADFAKFFTNEIEKANLQQLLNLWAYIGLYLQPVPQWQAFFTRTLRVWGEFSEKGRMHEDSLFSALKRAIKGREVEWLRLVVRIQPPLPPGTAEQLYWLLFHELPLEEREPYRAIIRQVVSDIDEKEFHYDLLSVPLDQKLAIIQQWVAYAKSTSILPPVLLIEKSLEYLSQQCNAIQLRTLHSQMLFSDVIAPYLEEQEPLLVKETFFDITLSKFEENRVALYKKYRHYRALSEAQRDILAGLIAMSDGQLDAELARRLYAYTSQLHPEAYYQEITSFLARMIRPGITSDMHRVVISALFSNWHAARFWAAYWSNLWPMFSRMQTGDLDLAIHLLSCWFSYAPHQFIEPGQRYIVQQFFLTMRFYLATIQQYQQFPEILTNVNARAASQSWYPPVQDILLERKIGFIERGQGLVRHMQDRFRDKDGSAANQELEQRCQREIDALLGKGTVREQHTRSLLGLYKEVPAEVFWKLYREKLVSVLFSPDSSHIFEILSFWFDESFTLFGQPPYIAQSFFCKLPLVFEDARKIHQNLLRRAAQNTTTYYNQLAAKGLSCEWYPVIRSFFLE